MTNRLMSIAVACTACAAMAVTTADYVQDGLIAHWDAIDNAGTGTHDPTATTWKNLVPGGMDLTIDDAVWADGNCLSNDVGFAAHGTAILDYTSCEFLIKNDKPSNAEMLMVFSNGRNKYLALTQHNYAQFINASFVTTAFSSNVGGIHSLGWVQGVTNYLDGSICASVYNPNGYGTTTFNHVYLGANTIGPPVERIFHGRYYSIRLYSRALTADEVYRNNIVDKIRYQGVRPADVALPEGWRFDDDVHLVQSRAGAATLVWRGAAGGRWADAANWSLNGEDVDYAPMELDTAVIASGSAPVVDAGQVVKVAAVTYADGVVAAGTYTDDGDWGSQAPWLSGAGVVRIASGAAVATATWTGNGADARVTNPANWGAADNTVLPDLHGETLTAEFTAGGEALLDDSVTWKGISFASSGAFTFADAAKALAIGSGGIETELAATPTVTHTFNVPMFLLAGQTWFANTNATIEFTKPLSFLSGSDTLTLSGAGQWNFRATSTFPNDVNATGDGMTPVGSGRVNAYADNALGGPGGKFMINLMHASLWFHGVVNSRPIETHSPVNDKDAGLHIMGVGKTNVFNATCSHTNKNLHLYLERGTTFIVNERFYTRSACYTSTSGSGGVRARWIMNVPLYVGDRFNLDSMIDLDLNAPTNHINGNTGNIWGHINLNVPYALAHVNGEGGGTQFIARGGTLDMHGNDNGLGVIYTHLSSHGGTITSDTPATMHLVDNYTIANYDSGQTDANGNKISVPGYTNRVTFTGCASLSKEGFFTNRLMKVSSTYGDLTVTRGRLEMDPGATWANASNLVVKGTGLFTLEEHPASAPAFGNHVVVRVEPGMDGSGANPQARIELLNATPQRCAELYVDGVRQGEGLWGSAEAAAANPGMRVRTAPFFSGTGLLRVYSGIGLTFFVR